MFERYDQKVVVFAFLVVFMSYCPQFWVLGRFAWLVRPDTCLGVRTKNSLFSCFMAVFMSYFPHFLGSGAICMPRKTRYMFEIYDQKLVSFALYGRFHELLPTVLGVSGRFAWLERLDTCLRVRTKNS